MQNFLNQIKLVVCDKKNAMLSDGILFNYLGLTLFPAQHLDKYKILLKYSASKMFFLRNKPCHPICISSRVSHLNVSYCTDICQATHFQVKDLKWSKLKWSHVHFLALFSYYVYKWQIFFHFHLMNSDT